MRTRIIETFEPTDQFWLQIQRQHGVLNSRVPHRITPENSAAQTRATDAVYASFASGAAEPVQKYTGRAAGVRPPPTMRRHDYTHHTIANTHLRMRI